jgi:drug/metabolite transporter (DMT)-like permease
MFNWALRHLAPTVVTIASIGEPVGASILALVILREIPALTDVLGGILICSGICLVLYFSPVPSEGRARRSSGR